MRNITCRIYGILLGISCLLFLFSCSQDSIGNDLKSTSDSDPTVSYEVSREVAINFMATLHSQSSKSRKHKTATAHLSRNLNSLKEIVPFDKEFANNTFRVFQFSEGGYVIVSSSKEQFPVLAYSEDDFFEIDPDFYENEALQQWINWQKEIIENLEYESIEVDDLTKSEIDSTWVVYSAPPIDEEVIVSGGTVDEVIQPLLSTRWNQGCGYNDLLFNCSTGGECGRVWTGCVATALAQVMKFHEYPVNYNWSNMPNDTGSPETARLMKDIGNAVNMDYACDGSGATMSNAANALKNTFGYSSSISLQDFNENTLFQQLDIWNTPVILSGGTHAWVCDGYKRKKHISIHNPGTHYEYRTYRFSQQYLHMNWGWGPRGGNGWFLYHDFTPGNNDFNANKKMIIWVKP